MANADQYYHGVPDGLGGVTLIPKEGPMARAVRRLQVLRFHDESFPLTGEPMNNLGLPGYRTPTSPPGRGRTGSGDRRYRARDQDEPPIDLDPDLEKLARGAPRNMIAEIYAMQRERDGSRGFNAAGDTCDCRGGDATYPPEKYRGEDFTEGQPLGDNMEDPEDFEQGEGEPDGDEPVVLATVDPPPDGYVLSLVPQDDDGGVALVLQPDLGQRNDPDLNVSDRTYRHKISQTRDATLVRMNQINRGHAVRDAVTSTLLRHRCLPGNKIVLRENEFGSIDVCLISWNPESDMMHEMGGAEDFDESDQSDTPAEAWVSGTAGKPGEHELPNPTLRNADRARFGDGFRNWETATLRSMNAAARDFWSTRR